MILGIELQSTFHFQFNVLSSLLSLLVVSLFFLIRFDFFSKLQLFLFATSFILGGSLLNTVNQRDDLNGETESFLVKIEDVAKNNRVWKKTIATKYATIDGGSIVKNQETVLLYFETKNIEVGDWLLVSSNLKKIVNKNNPGEFNAERYWRLKGIEKMSFVGDYQFLYLNNTPENWLGKLFRNSRAYFSSVLDEYLAGEQLGVAKALMLGDKGALSKEMKTSFGKAGAMHVLAVSGLHVGIVLAILMFIFRQFPRTISKRNALIFSLLIVWCYAGVTGFSPSVVRATIMFSLISLSVVFSRKNNSINALFFSAFLMMLWDPMIIYDIGFQLSYLAMIGIFAFYPSLSQLFLFKNRMFQKIWDGTAIGIAAQLTTFPLVLYYFHQFPNYFALTNLGMMVFAGLILGLGLVLFSIHWIPVLSKGIAFLFLISLSAMIYFVAFVEHLPGSIALGFELTPELVILIYLLLLLYYFFKKIKWILRGTVVVSLFVLGFIQFLRFENLNTSELVVFNSNQVILGVKHKNKLICLYEPRNKGLKNAKYLMEAYQKVKPGKIEYIELKKGNNVLDLIEHRVEMNCFDEGVRVQLDNQLFVLRKSYEMNIQNVDFVIDSPYLMDNPANFNLLHGSITLELKGKS